MDGKNIKGLKKHLTRNNLVLLGAVVIAVIFLVLSVQSMQKNHNLQRQVNEGVLTNEIQALENENLKLQQAYFQTDEFLELMARDKLNKAFPGEHLVHLPPIEKEVVVETGEAVRPVDTRSNFEKWIEFFFGSR